MFTSLQKSWTSQSITAMRIAREGGTCCRNPASYLCLSVEFPNRQPLLGVRVTRPEDILEALEPGVALAAEAAEEQMGIGRREFMFRSLVAAAATTFGAQAALAQAAAGAPSAAMPTPMPQQPQATPPFPLGNGEPPAEQFMPYPGGTGALMEKLVKEHGAKVFDRSVFTVEKWSGAVPTSDEEIAFLPAHRLSALLRAKKITSTRLTSIY